MNRDAMQEGRERAARKRREEAVQRVQEFEAWSRSGEIRGIPEIPTDADYRAARAAGAEGVRP